MPDAQREIQQGVRFAFGNNWRAFLSTLDEDKILEAEKSLQDMLQVQDLKGKTFLDAGCGSGLFSLAAKRLGAKVTSFDFDPASVACAETLRQRYFSETREWKIMQGSVLDPDFLQSLGTFDITYSWGVLHHTGNMWRALENIIIPVAVDGLLFIAIYNDQGFKSRIWKKVKRAYCRNRISRALISTIFYPYMFLRTTASSLVNQKNQFTECRKNRGMSIVHDWRDWLGGYPFEVATTADIFRYYNSRGFILTRLESSCGIGNNQFVFHLPPAAIKPLQISTNRSP